MRLVIPLFALLLLLNVTLFCSGASTGQCSGAATCSACITAHSTCKWCLDEDYESERCQSDLNQEMGESECTEWENPKSALTKQENGFTNIIQVQPSAIKINKLRPGEIYNISVSVKSSPNYPLDLYYLMDFSFSMQGDLEKLKTLAGDIVDNLANISTDYSLGFGTFVDKPTAPYANTENGALLKPCTGCQAVHSFNHEMSMTTGAGAGDELKSRLDNIKISSNIDNPEGGFDAMVQAAVCSNEIGWRDPARRVIFYASDAVFHVAGDGKLAGIVKPNEGTCGMDSSTNKYTKSLVQDYPSLGQLNDILIKNKVIPIFAVTSGMQGLYEELSNHLTQLSSVGKLSDNSDDVATLIKKQLNSIISTTKLNPQAPTGVTVSVTPRCSGSQVETQNGCSGVQINEEVKFDVILNVDECLADSDNTYSFNIEVPGIATIPVEIEMICKCDCETDGSRVDNSAECSGVGDLICGSCQCHSGTYGEFCQCNQTTEVSTEECVNPETKSICGGDNNGKCICGQCECIQPTREGYMRWGKYCECSNYECPRNLNNAICSNNGYCFCGECDCDKTPNGTPKQPTDPQYTGDDCGCPVSKADCIHPTTGLECSGPSNGECICGACSCKQDHYGEFCDICQDCGPLNCTMYTDCVECMFKGKEDGKTWRECNCDVETIISSDERVDTSKLGRHKQCTPIPWNENCDIIFYLHYEDKGTTNQPVLNQILIDREPDCPTQPNIIAIVAGVIGGILGVGILLLIIWKIFTSIMDKREYTKFLEERSKAKWNTGLSPLYKEPMTKYVNPLYTAAASRI